MPRRSPAPNTRLARFEGAPLASTRRTVAPPVDDSHLAFAESKRALAAARAAAEAELARRVTALDRRARALDAVERRQGERQERLDQRAYELALERQRMLRLAKHQVDPLAA